MTGLQPQTRLECCLKHNMRAVFSCRHGLRQHVAAGRVAVKGCILLRRCRRPPSNVTAVTFAGQVTRQESRVIYLSVLDVLVPTCHAQHGCANRCCSSPCSAELIEPECCASCCPNTEGKTGASWCSEATVKMRHRGVPSPSPNGCCETPPSSSSSIRTRIAAAGHWQDWLLQAASA